LGLGELALVVMLLTFSLEGASSKMPLNQPTRTKKIQNQPKNVKHKRSRTNENVTRVKSNIHEAWKPTKRQFNFWMNLF
jgi:hypothetical protein